MSDFDASALGRRQNMFPFGHDTPATPPPPTASPAAERSGELADELAALPGINQTVATRIVAAHPTREALATVSETQLMAIDGVGRARAETISNHATSTTPGPAIFDLQPAASTAKPDGFVSVKLHRHADQLLAQVAFHLPQRDNGTRVSKQDLASDIIASWGQANLDVLHAAGITWEPQ